MTDSAPKAPRGDCCDSPPGSRVSARGRPVFNMTPEVREQVLRAAQRQLSSKRSLSPQLLYRRLCAEHWSVFQGNGSLKLVPLGERPSLGQVKYLLAQLVKHEPLAFLVRRPLGAYPPESALHVKRRADLSAAETRAMEIALRRPELPPITPVRAALSPVQRLSLTVKEDSK